MGSIFKSPPKPKPIQIIREAVKPVADVVKEAPSRAAKPVQEAGEEAVRRLRRGRGRASTIITALSGDLPAGAVARKTLLGGS